MMQYQDQRGGDPGQDAASIRKIELQDVMNERRRVASEYHAWAKAGVDFVRVVVWPILILVIGLSALGILRQRSHHQPWSTASVVSLTAQEQRHRLAEEMGLAGGGGRGPRICVEGFDQLCEQDGAGAGL